MFSLAIDVSLLGWHWLHHNYVVCNAHPAGGTFRRAGGNAYAEAQT